MTTTNYLRVAASDAFKSLIVLRAEKGVQS